MPKIAQEPTYYSIISLAKLWDCSRGYVYQRCVANRYPAIQIDGKWLIPYSWIKEETARRDQLIADRFENTKSNSSAASEPVKKMVNVNKKMHSELIANTECYCDHCRARRDRSTSQSQ